MGPKLHKFSDTSSVPSFRQSNRCLEVCLNRIL